MTALAEMPPYMRAINPPSAKLLGWDFESANEERGEVVIWFDGRQEFTNPGGDVQGGILAAMLDDALGPAVLIKSRGTVYAPTIQMNLHFMKPVAPGRIRVEARCIHLGRTIAHIEGVLFNPDGEAAVKATATSRVIPLEKIRRT